MIEDYFETGVVTKRTTKTTGNMGESVDSWATNLSIEGIIRPLSGKEKEDMGKMGVEASYKMYCKVLDITEKDRIVFESITYEVVSVINPMFMNHHLEIFLKRVK